MREFCKKNKDIFIVISACVGILGAGIGCTLAVLGYNQVANNKKMVTNHQAALVQVVEWINNVQKANNMKPVKDN